jgi:hypothetical protein
MEPSAYCLFIIEGAIPAAAVTLAVLIYRKGFTLTSKCVHTLASALLGAICAIAALIGTVDLIVIPTLIIRSLISLAGGALGPAVLFLFYWVGNLEPVKRW